MARERGVCMYVRGSVLFQAEFAKMQNLHRKETVIPARGSQAQRSWWRETGCTVGWTRRWGNKKARISAIPERGACD